MKRERGAALAEGIRMLRYFRELDRDSTVNRIQMDASEAHLTDAAILGLEGIFQEEIAKAEAKSDALESWLDKSRDMNIQQRLFDQNGKPTTPADANGKLIPQQRHDGPDPDYINPDHGEQPELPLEDREAEAKAAPPIDWKLGAQADGIRAGIIQELRNGSGKTLAIKNVMKAAGKGKAEVESHWDALVRNGIVRKQGANWVADLVEDFPMEATSETPDEPLVAADTSETSEPETEPEPTEPTE